MNIRHCSYLLVTNILCSAAGGEDTFDSVAARPPEGLTVRNVGRIGSNIASGSESMLYAVQVHPRLDVLRRQDQCPYPCAVVY